MTAARWAAILESLGHEVVTLERWTGEPCDVLVALHARKSFPSVDRFRRARPEAPVIVALTGTDLYADLPDDADARASVEIASRLVALQPKAADALPPPARSKMRVIYQSAEPPVSAGPRVARGAPVGQGFSPAFTICLLSHLRGVKDPLRAAKAARLLPPDSRIRIVHAGRALEDALEEEARREQAENQRYRWLGELSRDEAWELLTGSQLLAVTSRLEGGANVVSEAIAAGVPVVSSRIDGSIGLLGEDYPGYFPVGDTAALAALLHRAECDEPFYGELRARCLALQPLFDPARERESWRALLAEL